MCHVFRHSGDWCACANAICITLPYEVSLYIGKPQQHRRTNELQEELEKAGILRDVVPKVLADVELTVRYGGEHKSC